MAQQRLVLIDGSALIYRAFFAIPSSFMTPEGLHTNAVYGFALMLNKLLAGRFPDHAAVVFDTPKPTFRAERYPEYKADRPPMDDTLREQIPWIHKLVDAHRLPRLAVPGYEADDIIGTLTKQAVAAGMEVLIVSGDKDFAQLIGPKVRMLDSMRQVTYDAELVQKKWGVPPEQFVDFLALMGDKVDNIPGVPGIGKKTAATLLERFGDLQTVLDSTEQLKGRQKANLVEFRAQALLCQELATIDCQVPLELGVSDLAVEPPEMGPIDALYTHLHFFSLLSVKEEKSARPATQILSDPTALQAWLDAASGPIAIAPANEAPGAISGELYGMALATETQAVFVAWPNPALAQWLESDAPKVGHHLRLASTALERQGLVLDGLHGDSALASFLVDPAGLLPHRLDQVAKQQLQVVLPVRKDLVGAGKSEKRLAELEPQAVAEHFGQRASTSWACFDALAPQLEELDLSEQLELDLELAQVLGRMQTRGICVDAQHLEGLQKDFAKRAADCEARIHVLAGRPFNVQSVKQLSAVLFEELELPVIKRTKTGYSTNAEVLTKLAKEHEIAQVILDYRALIKLVNTYTQVLRDAVSPEGRVHCNLQQTVGVSGRLITTDPDLQRTPIRSTDGKRIREAFVPKAGWVMISADWSQIELRVLAHISADPLLLDAFRTAQDVHRRTAAEVFDVPPDEVTPEQRNVGKTVNFATIYGQGATALGQQLGMTRKQAQAMIQRYFERYEGVKTWVETTVARAHETGEVHTLMGRRRIVRELKSKNFAERGYGERIAANTPIQGSAADLCKLAMLSIDKELKAAGCQGRMLLQIHDELLFECPPEELEQVTDIVRRAMETPMDLDVPLVVDIGNGKSWAEAH